jgi:hypothetical protein
MKVNKSIIGITLIPLLVTAILGLAGLLKFTVNAVSGAECIGVGIYLVYKYMHTDREWVLFAGSSLFLAGLLLFFLNYYYFPKPLDLIFSALPFVISVNFLLLFINKPKDIVSVYLACVFFIAGWFIAAYFGTLSLRAVFYDFISILRHYWIIIILIIIQLYYLIKNN